jgi:hypothetical protein
MLNPLIFNEQPIIMPWRGKHVSCHKSGFPTWFHAYDRRRMFHAFCSERQIQISARHDQLLGGQVTPVSSLGIGGNHRRFEGCLIGEYFCGWFATQPRSANGVSCLQRGPRE